MPALFLSWLFSGLDMMHKVYKEQGAFNIASIPPFPSLSLPVLLPPLFTTKSSAED